MASILFTVKYLNFYVKIRYFYIKIIYEELFNIPPSAEVLNAQSLG